MTEAEMTQWIDTADYESLLWRWRFHPAGSPWFQGVIGAYYSKKLAARREEVGAEEHVRASKAVGWDRPPIP